MKRTSDKSKGISRKWSEKCLFCSGSRTSSIAEAGSPRKSDDILSISSSSKTGLRCLAGGQPLIVRPCGAPRRGGEGGDVLAGRVPGKPDDQVEMGVQDRDPGRAGGHPLQSVDV